MALNPGSTSRGSFVIWSGLKVAARPPDDSHPYGHGKAEPIAAVDCCNRGPGRRCWSGHSKRARNLPAASRAGAVHARDIDRGDRDKGNFVPLRQPDWPQTWRAQLCKPTPGTIAAMRSRQLLHSSAFQLRLIGGKGWQSADDWAALFACARHQLQMASGFCARRFTKSWTPRREKSSSPFAQLPAPSPVSSKLKNAALARWAWIFMSIFTSEWMARFPCTKATRSRIE